MKEEGLGQCGHVAVRSTVGSSSLAGSEPRAQQGKVRQGGEQGQTLQDLGSPWVRSMVFILRQMGI